MEHGVFVADLHQFRMNGLVAIRHQPVHQIQAFVVASLCDRLFGIHGFRLLRGLRDAAGEGAGAEMEGRDGVAVGLPRSNANVGEGEGDGVPDADDEGDGEGLGVGLGVGDGIMFSQ